MDIRIEGEISNDEIFEALRQVMPLGIEITAVKEPELDPKLIAYGDFDITFYDFADTADFSEKIASMLAGDELIVQKLGKKGRKKVYKDINLMEHIKSSSVRADGDALVLNVILPAGSTTNINPALLADEIQKLQPDTRYIIRRKRLLTSEMEEFK